MSALRRETRGRGAPGAAGSRPTFGSLAVAAALATLAAVAPFRGWRAATAAPPAQRPAAPGVVGQGGPQPHETFAEKVLVREVEVVVEIPDSLRESRRKALGPQDFQVTEDGRLRQVVKASPVNAGDAGPWQLVIYVDRVLADPETVFFTANSLAQRSAELTGLGTVALVVADPAPRMLLAETREPRMLEQALIDIASQAERQKNEAHPPGAPGKGHDQGRNPGQDQGQQAAARDQGRDQGQGQSQGRDQAKGQASAQPPGRGPTNREGGPPAAPEGVPGPRPEVVRHQEDQLVALLAGRPGGGPRALVLVANGFDTSRSGDGADSATAAVADEPARTLAAYGWITLAAPMRRQELGIAHREMTDVERIRQSNSGRQAPGSSVPPEILPQAAPKSRLQYEGVLSLFVEPTSASLIAMASATSGTLIGYPAQLASALTGLRKRWHIFYLAPDPGDGRPRPVEVRLSPEGTLLRTPVWRRSSTPDEVAAARVREILTGGADHGTLPLSVTATAAAAGAARSAQEHGSVVRLTVGAFSPPDSLAPGPYRVTLAFAGAAGSTPAVQHQVLNGADLTEQGWTKTLPLEVPPGSRKLGVAVEDLAHQIWGATAVDLGAPPATH